MKFKGKTLILDNFRQVLKEYTVDVQDVVRSAILDDIDISKYIDSSSPYKLEQIRLALKEGLNPTFFSVKGEMLYQIRKLAKEGLNLSPLEKQLKSNLSEEHTDYVVHWILDGVKFSNINIALVPKRLLPIYDRGLRAGIDMSKYSKIQKTVSTQYIDACVVLESSGKNTQFLCDNVWGLSVVALFRKYSDLSSRNWEEVEKYISPEDPVDRVNYLIQMIRNNIDVAEVQKKNNNDYVYDTDCLLIILKGYKENIDIKELMKYTTSEKMDEKLSELKLKKGLKVSGRFMRKPN